MKIESFLAAVPAPARQGVDPERRQSFIWHGRPGHTARLKEHHEHPWVLETFEQTEEGPKRKSECLAPLDFCLTMFRNWLRAEGLIDEHSRSDSTHSAPAVTP